MYKSGVRARYLRQEQAALLLPSNSHLGQIARYPS